MVVVPLAFFGTLLLIIRWSLEYSKWKKRPYQEVASDGKSLGTGELKALIREAVEDANEPLLDRVEALEARLDTLVEAQLTAARSTPLLDEALDTFETDITAASRPQRVS